MPVLLLWLALCAGAAAVRAAPVLHEPVPVPQLRCEGGICRRDGSEPTALPEAVLGADDLVHAPTQAPTARADEPIYDPAPLSGRPATSGTGPAPAALGIAPLRRTHVAPDRDTGPEGPGEHLYHEVFNPAVFPFKRMSVLDAVAEDETLYLRGPDLTPLAPAGAARLKEGRDPFYGSVMVDFVAQQPVPIPSPAAGLRLLSYQALPPLPLRFYRDGADNLYVIAAGRGRRRLNYLVDAPQRYFAGPLSDGVRPRLGDVPAPALQRLPPRVQRRADLVLRHIGIGPQRDQDFEAALSRLVGYFREFQLGDVRSRSGSTYLDLALEQRGSCRHRSYAFVITALGAGIPARYVENELHVFVEVFVPSADGGEGGYWRRINLGGAPLPQRLVDMEDKVAYRDKGEDPFPRPPAFRNAPPPPSEAAPRPPAPRAAPPLAPGATGVEAGAGPGRRSGAGSGDRTGAPPGRSADGKGRGAGKGAGSGPGAPDPIEDTADPDALDPRPAAARLIPTQVSLQVPAGTPRRLYRGMAVRVQGRVQARAGSPAGLEVYLYLDTRPAPLLLGRSTTGPDGSYQAELEIPPQAPLGDHRLVARVRGDDSRRGSSTR